MLVSATLLWCALGCALSCFAPPKSTAEIERAHQLEELLEIVTSGQAEPLELDGALGSAGSESEAGTGTPVAAEAYSISPADAARARDFAEGKQSDENTAPRVTPPERQPNPYMTFGERIVVHSDGRITKPYPMPPGKGKRMLDLMTLMAGQGLFPVEVIDPAKPIQPNANAVQVMLLPNWDMELYQDLRAFPPVDKETPTADWLVCTAGFELLEEVEYFIDLFGAGVPQFEIEAQIVELTETDVFDWGVESVDFTLPSNTFVDTIGFAFPNVETANELILDLGAIQDGTTFDAILHAVKSWENVSIISRPKVAVREGGKAEILNIEDLPFLNIKTINDNGTFTATIDYKQVGIRLYIVPRIIGSDTLALHIDLEASQEAGLTTTTVGTGANKTELRTPRIAKRSVNTVVYLKKGQALILGGLTTTRSREVEEGVPFLSDIPLIGWLFKSKFSQVTRTHVLFFIRPRILEGTDFQREF